MKQLTAPAAKPLLRMVQKRAPDPLTVVLRMHGEDVVLRGLRELLLQGNETDYDAAEPRDERRELRPREILTICVRSTAKRAARARGR